MLGCRDVQRSSAFYDALLAPIGITRSDEDVNDLPYACWVHPDQPTSKFFVCLPLDDRSATVGNGSMVAFHAASPSIVDEAYQAGLSHGGTDEGLPGPRPQYGEKYYGAYLRDPDGNKIHLVHHG